MADTEQTDITATSEWTEVAQHHAAVAPRLLRDLFADDPGRVEALTATGADLVMDYSKNRITRDTRPAAHRARPARGAARAHRGDVLRACTSTPARTAPCCTRRCGCPTTRR